jgi:4-diphosphocytidyl-2-C-methyl-D-erythritol kinase
VATGVGSDVPFFVRGGTQWARGRGELLEPAPAPALHVVVVDSGLRLATGEVYARFDLLPPPKRPAEGPYNDLWPAARACEPRLAEVADDIAAAGADEVLLCGSGGAMAGLFAARSAAEVAAEALSPRHRCWVARPAPASPGAGPG